MLLLPECEAWLLPLDGWWKAEDASLLLLRCKEEDRDARCDSCVAAEEEDAAGPASNGTVPYSLLHPGHWLRQCSLICCKQNRHTRYLQLGERAAKRGGEGLNVQTQMKGWRIGAPQPFLAQYFLLAPAPPDHPHALTRRDRA